MTEDSKNEKQQEESIAAPSAAELDKILKHQEHIKQSNTDEPDVDHDLIQYGAKVNRIEIGEELYLMEMDPTLKEVTIGLGWDLRAVGEGGLDLDASLFLLNKDDMTRVDEDFIFYNNPINPEGTVRHKGDNRTGAGDGDDETIDINLATLSYEIIKIVFVVSIYDDEFRGHNFSQVKNVFFRMVNKDNEHEMFRVEYEEDTLGDGMGIVVAEMERIGQEWIFRAQATPIEEGLAEIAENYGLLIAERVQA